MEINPDIPRPTLRDLYRVALLVIIPIVFLALLHRGGL